jgi:hypothetical protein
MAGIAEKHHGALIICPGSHFVIWEALTLRVLQRECMYGKADSGK